MHILPVTETNLHIYHNLVQCYEAEFSPITGKKPDASGRFALDTEIGDNVVGYLLYIGETPAGLAAIARKEEDHFEMCEFYVVPYFRKNAIGMQFAHAIWSTCPGEWEIKQIQGAESGAKRSNALTIPPSAKITTTPPIGEVSQDRNLQYIKKKNGMGKKGTGYFF